MRACRAAIAIVVLAAGAVTASDVVIETAAPNADGSGSGLLVAPAAQLFEVAEWMQVERIQLWLSSSVPVASARIRISLPDFTYCDGWVPSDTGHWQLRGFETPPLGPDPRLVMFEFDGGGPILKPNYLFIVVSNVGDDGSVLRWSYSATGQAINGSYVQTSCMWRTEMNPALAMRIEGPLRTNSCRADWDASGGVDGDDLAAFLRDWEAGRADSTGNGRTDEGDLVYFFDRWQRGC